MTEPYVELHAASAFSFLEAASLPEALIERAVELEIPAMALLDRNGFYGSARFHTLGKKKNVRAHIGAEISVKDFGARLTPRNGFPIGIQKNRLDCHCCVLRGLDIKTYAR